MLRVRGRRPAQRPITGASARAGTAARARGDHVIELRIGGGGAVEVALGGGADGSRAVGMGHHMEPVGEKLRLVGRGEVEQRAPAP